MNRKVITFSLWGDNPNYNVGAVENAKLASEFYPDFECWFYIHKESVPEQTIKNLKFLKNTRIIFEKDISDKGKPMMWRFKAIDDPEVDIMMPRDTDTRILLREKLAVQEWLESGKVFHVMRDHPFHGAHHMRIPGGMFGTKKIAKIKSWTDLMSSYISPTGHKNYNYDQYFLKKYIYPKIKKNMIIHSSCTKLIGESIKPFPIPHSDTWQFVGEYVYSDGSRCQEHIDMLKTFYTEQKEVMVFNPTKQKLIYLNYKIKRILYRILSPKLITLIKLIQTKISIKLQKPK